HPVAWTPHVLDGEVRALAQVGNRMFVGGLFTQVRDAGQQAPSQRPYLFSFASQTGAIDTSFAPGLDGEVEALAPSPDGRSLFVGGQFHHLNGAAATGLAKLDVATGQAVPGFRATLGGTSAWVFSLALSGGR